MKLYFSIAILFSLVIASGLGSANAQSTPETTEPPFYPSECDDMPRETLEEKIEKRECRVAEAQRGVDYAPPSRVQLWVDELEIRQAGLDRLLEKQAAAAESTEPATTPVPVPEPTPEATPEPTPTISQNDNAVIEALTAQLEALTTHMELLAMQLEELKSKMETMESTTVINQETDVQQQYFDLDPLNIMSRGITTLNDKFYVVDESVGSYGNIFPDHKVYAYNADGTRDAASDFDLSLDNASQPSGIAALNDKFWVLDLGRYHPVVLAYNSDGTRDEASDFELSHKSNGYSSGIAAHDGKLWVLDSYPAKVTVYNTNGTVVLDYKLVAHSGFSPQGIISHDGKLWVVDQENDIVHAYNPEFSYESSIFTVASSDFVLDRLNGNPQGMTVLDDKFYVVDSHDKRVYIYNADGTNPLQ